MSTSDEKIRLLCSYGGHITPQPHDKHRRLRYVGGDTRIVSLPRRSPSLRELLLKLSRFSPSSPFSLKYQHPSHDLDSLTSLASEEDFRNMLLEHEQVSKQRPRIRVFIFPRNSLDSLMDHVDLFEVTATVEIASTLVKGDGRTSNSQESNSLMEPEPKHMDQCSPVLELLEQFVKQQQQQQKQVHLNPILTQAGSRNDSNYNEHTRMLFPPTHPNASYSYSIPIQQHNPIEQFVPASVYVPITGPPPIPSFIHLTKKSNQEFSGYHRFHDNAAQSINTGGYWYGNAIKSNGPMNHVDTPSTQLGNCISPLL